MAVEVAKVLAGPGAGAGMQNRGRRLDRQAGGLCRPPEPRRLKVAGGFWREIGQLARPRATGRGPPGGGQEGVPGVARLHPPALDPKTFEGIDPADLDRLEEARAWRRAG
jgi:hypothetical protein